MIRGLAPRQWLQVAAVALLNVLLYPPFSLILPSFIVLIPLVWLLQAALVSTAPGYRGALAGFWTGLAVNAVSLYWMVTALYHFTPLAVLGYFAAVLLMAAWWALLGWGVVTVWRRVPGVPAWLTFACCWTAMEWSVGHAGDLAFPWLGLGTSLTGTPLLVQWADVAGARGVTLWLAACNAALASCLDRPERWRRNLGLVAASAFLALAYGVWRERTLVIRPLGTVALIQPDVGYDRKWRAGAGDGILDGLLRQSRTVLNRERPDLVIWPEAAVPGYFADHPQWADSIAALAREYRRPIVVGGLDAVPDRHGREEMFNASFLFDSSGAWQTNPAYHKHYLVPIVERVPFISPHWSRGLPGLGAFEHGRAHPVFRVPLGRFGVVICFESAFERPARVYRGEEAEFLVNITNDKWFGTTSAPAQHAAHLVMRAIETRMGIARAANSGISEVVDPLGVPSGRTALDTSVAVVLTLSTSDVIPLYVVWGDWVGVLALLGTAALGWAAWRESRA